MAFRELISICSQIQGAVKSQGAVKKKINVRNLQSCPYFYKIPKIHQDPSKISPSNSTVLVNKKRKTSLFRPILLYLDLFETKLDQFEIIGPILKKIRPTQN